MRAKTANGPSRRDNIMNNTKAMQAVAVAAIQWNRARLLRIAIAKRVPADWRHPQHMAASDVLAEARRAEAKAKAALRKACGAADPASVVIDLVPMPQKSVGGQTRGGGSQFSVTDHGHEKD